MLAHPYVVALCAIAAATGLFVLGRPYFAKGQWALLYLLIVALIARAGGAGPALLAAALSFVAWNFFLLPPYHTLLVADSKDWLALAALLLVGLVVGIQTGRLRDREARAIARERESTLLARLSANLVSEVSVEAMGRVVVDEVSRLMRPTRVMLFVPDDDGDCRLLAGSPEGVPPLDREHDAAEWVLATGAPSICHHRCSPIADDTGDITAAHAIRSRRRRRSDDDSIYLPSADHRTGAGRSRHRPALTAAGLRRSRTASGRLGRQPRRRLPRPSAPGRAGSSCRCRARSRPAQVLAAVLGLA